MSAQLPVNSRIQTYVLGESSFPPKLQNIHEGTGTVGVVLKVLPCSYHRRCYLRPTGTQVSQILVRCWHQMTSLCCCYTHQVLLLARGRRCPGVLASRGEKPLRPSLVAGGSRGLGRGAGKMAKKSGAAEENGVPARASSRAEGSAQGRGQRLWERIVDARFVLGTPAGRSRFRPLLLLTLKREALLVLLPPSPIF